MGTPLFAATVLEGLLNANYNIVGVVTQTDKKVGRKQQLSYSKVKEVAIAHGIDVFQPERIKDDYAFVIDKKPDLIITSAYGQFSPKALLDCPPYGCINTHASLLPRYRGGAPIQRSIINGEKESGVSIIYMTEKMDEGDILLQKALPIAIDDTNETLFEKLSDLAKDMLLELLPDLFAGNIHPVAQNNNEASYAYNLKKEEEFISFDDDVRRVYDHIRGLLKNPGAYGILDGKKFKFMEVGYQACDKELMPGTLASNKDNPVLIACRNGYIIVKRIQPEGKKEMDSKSFYNGQGRNLVGHQFERKIANG